MKRLNNNETIVVLGASFNGVKEMIIRCYIGSEILVMMCC